VEAEAEGSDKRQFCVGLNLTHLLLQRVAVVKLEALVVVVFADIVV
jgi:hypothetical protein